MDTNHTPLGQPKIGRPWIRHGLGFLVIALAFLALITYQVYNAHAVATANAEANVKNLTMILESTLEQALREARQEVITVATDIDVEAMRPANANRYRPQISRWLKSLASPIPDSLALRVFDANGDSLYSSNDNEPAFNIADRNYFRQLQADPSIHVLFSDVFFGRVTRQPAIFAVKAVRDHNGAFLGIALNGLELSSLHQYFAAIELGTEGIVAVRRLDNGAYVVRYPGAFEITNEPAMDLPIRAALLKDGHPGSLEFAPPVDGIRRIYGYRRIGDLPFFVVVGTSAKDYLAGWRQTTSISLLTSLLFLATLAAVFLRLARAEARRGQMMALLQTREQSYRTLTEWSPEPLVVHDGSTFIYANPAAIKLFGARSAQDLVGKPIFDRVHPDFRDISRARVKRSFEQGGTLPMQEMRFLKLDGVAIDVEVQSTSIAYDGVVAVQVALRDVTERKVADQQLVDSEQRFRSLVEQAVAGAYIVQDGKFVYVNPRAAEIIGLGSAEELVGSDPLQSIAEADRSRVAQNMRRVLAGETQNVAMDFAALRRDGVTVQIGGNASRAMHQGRPAIIGLMQDISEKKRAEAEIGRYIEQLKVAFMSTVEIATTLSEMRDPYTAGHERRVGKIAVAIGAELGLDEQRIEGLRVAGYLHDIGKISIPAEILSKPGKLSEIELKLIQGHSQAGYDVLKDVKFPWPVAQVALQHQERMDGSGYPQGLKGEAILFEARIVAVADVIEAMSSHRPYRAGLGIEAALAEIEAGSGTRYDPAVVSACLKLFREKGYAIPA